QYAAPGRTVAFKSFGLPKSVTTNAGTTSFAYDGANARVLKVKGDKVIVTLGPFERRLEAGQATDVFYAVGNGRPVAQIIWHESSSNSVTEEVQYLHEDHLQSIEAVTDASAHVVTRQRFDPFGNRMSLTPAGTRLGYQGAEEDD